MLEESHAHASHVATSRQAWVYEVQGDQYLGSGVNSAHTGGVVSLCEVGRRSQRVAVITKIVTLSTHRHHGYATRLLLEVMRLWVFILTALWPLIRLVQALRSWDIYHHNICCKRHA